jgi:hypothetical protein
MCPVVVVVVVVMMMMMMISDGKGDTWEKCGMECGGQDQDMRWTGGPAGEPRCMACSVVTPWEGRRRR